jgi:hypothetical protein
VPQGGERGVRPPVTGPILTGPILTGPTVTGPPPPPTPPVEVYVVGPRTVVRRDDLGGAPSSRARDAPQPKLERREARAFGRVEVPPADLVRVEVRDREVAQEPRGDARAPVPVPVPVPVPWGRRRRPGPGGQVRERLFEGVRREAEEERRGGRESGPERFGVGEARERGRERVAPPHRRDGGDERRGCRDATRGVARDQQHAALRRDRARQPNRVPRVQESKKRLVRERERQPARRPPRYHRLERFRELDSVRR